MNAERMQRVLVRFQSDFRACFSALTDQDMHAILAAPREQLLSILGARYGYSAAETKAAWNEFVLRYVDGPAVKYVRPNSRGSKQGRIMPKPPFAHAQFARHARPWLRQLPLM